jgi:type VI secretion system VgrG family protein
MRQTVFELEVSGHAGAALQVVKFEGEECLTRPYRFDIDIICQNPSLPLDDILMRPATFTLRRGEDLRQISGLIRTIVESGESAGGFYAYRMTLVPRIALLGLSQHNRSFGTHRPMSVIDVVLDVLTDPNGLALAQDSFSVQVLQPEAYPEREFWAQYEESDFDFVHRLLEHWGIFYYFEQDEAGERVIFTDTTTLLPLQKIDAILSYDGHNKANPDGLGAALTVSRTLQTVTKTVELKDYNDQMPQLTLTADAAVPKGGFGRYSEYAAHFRTNAEGGLFAKARSEEIGCTRDVFDLKTNSAFLTSAAIFSVEAHFRPHLNQSYMPTAIRHQGRQNIAGAFWEDATPVESGYHNEVTAVPAGVAYRSPRQIRRPVMGGVMPAVVEAQGDETERATLDPQGRYKVAIDFDTTDNPLYQRSPFLRRLQTYAGPNIGLHFPLLKKTEVMIGWVDGDPDRPLILGAVPNAQSVSPVVKSNETENMMRTASGIAFIMNDGPGQTHAAGQSDAAPAAAGPVSHASAAGQSGHETPPRGPAPTPPSGHARSPGVYSALVVPSSTGGAPHYTRHGDVAAADGFEGQMMSSPAFRAGQILHRGTALDNASYGGIFSYTGQNRTSTIGSHETVSIMGDHRMTIGGTSTTVVGGQVLVATPPSPSPDNPNTTTGPATATTTGVGGRTIAIQTTTSAYVADLSYVPQIYYYDSVYVSYSLGVTYLFTGGLELDVYAGGQFTSQLGWSVAVGAIQDYSIDRGGAMTNGLNGIDTDIAIFASGGSVVLGYRPLSGAAAQAGAATVAKAVAGTTAAAAVVGELGQGPIIAADAMGSTTTTALTTVAQGLSVLPTTVAYATALATVMSYFNTTQETLTVPNMPGQPTLTINATGIILTAGAVSLRVTEDLIAFVVGASLVTIDNDGIVMGVGENELALSAASLSASVTDFALECSGDCEISAATSVDILASLLVTDDIATSGDITATGSVTAVSVMAG